MGVTGLEAVYKAAHVGAVRHLAWCERLVSWSWSWRQLSSPPAAASPTLRLTRVLHKVGPRSGAAGAGAA